MTEMILGVPLFSSCIEGPEYALQKSWAFAEAYSPIEADFIVDIKLQYPRIIIVTQYEDEIDLNDVKSPVFLVMYIYSILLTTC